MTEIIFINNCGHSVLKQSFLVSYSNLIFHSPPLYLVCDRHLRVRSCLLNRTCKAGSKRHVKTHFRHSVLILKIVNIRIADHCPIAFVFLLNVDLQGLGSCGMEPLGFAHVSGSKFDILQIMSTLFL